MTRVPVYLLGLAIGLGGVPQDRIVHGSTGMGTIEDGWSREFIGMDIAAVRIDGFTGRGIAGTDNDQSRLGTLTMINDAYRAREQLSSDSRIDASQTLQAPSRPAAGFRDCAECPEMVSIPAGDFMMGSDATEQGRADREGPQRRVQVGQFAAGKFELTRAQWAAFASATNRETLTGCFYTARSGNSMDPIGSWRDTGFSQDDSHPVVCVTWDDAQDYTRWLSQRTGHKYRLLSEAEWEYAARAGSTTPYPWGPAPSHELANYGGDTCCSPLATGRDRWLHTSPTGSFPANAFGLHDMHGNVLEWVQDCFAPSYFGLPINGSAYEAAVSLEIAGRFASMNGTSSCSYRMLRGGDWNNPPASIRSAYRNFGPGAGATLQDYRSTGVGFRVARAGAP
jgi:formylglycine-generating enzyme required for sulfatase activity